MRTRLRIRSYCIFRVLALAALTLAVGPHIGRADESTRRRLLSEIDELLEEIADELDDVPSDSSTSDLDGTVRMSEQVANKARELESHIDGDARADDVADDYPDYARAYQDAARSLRELKNGYRKNDEWPKKCEAATRELTSRMRGYTDSHDPRGAEEVPKLAREFGRLGKDAIEQSERVKNEMASWYDRVDDFAASDGKWSAVRGSLHGVGRMMAEQARQQWEQTKRDEVCGNLAQEGRNPLVEEVMRKLFEGKKGIEMVYESIDRQLSEMAGALDSLDDDTSDADIQSAERKLAEVERLLEQLDRIKGSDGEARRRVETWRNIAAAGRAALPHLRTLKQSQFATDKAPDKCKETDERLRESIRGYLDRRDPKGAKELPLRARGFAEPIKAGLAKTDEKHRDMEQAAVAADRFDAGDGRWRDVRDRLRTSARDMFDYWKQARDTAHAACDELAKGDEHKDVVRAVAELLHKRSDNTTELDRVKADHRKWYEALSELRQFFKTDTRAVRDAFCEADESPGDAAWSEYARVIDAIADRMRDRINHRWDELRARADALDSRLAILEASGDDEVEAPAAKLRRELSKTTGSVQSFLSGEAMGANNPRIRARMEMGKNEHKRIQADSSKCTVSEMTFGSMRVDCVRVDGNTCYVVEIKPNNRAAQPKGRKQIEDGISAIERALAGRSKKSELTGTLEVFRACFDDSRGDAKLDRELRVYDYCPAEGELFHDLVVP